MFTKQEEPAEFNQFTNYNGKKNASVTLKKYEW